NATILPNNLLANPDVDSPPLGSASTPSSWNRSSSAIWATDAAVSPTHSLKIADASALRVDEWRSYATALPEGEDRVLELSWFWKFDLEPGSEFRARLRLSPNGAIGPSLSNPQQEQNYILSGEVSEFELFTTTLALPDWAQSFDLSFISGGSNAMLGTLYVDDISAAIAATAQLQADYDLDGDVDGRDLLAWQRTLGSAVTPGNGADGNQNGIVDAADLDVWRQGFPNSSSLRASILAAGLNVPEPGASALALAAMGVFCLASRKDG
ncbi:MAG TPA: PEP-CTERM sorting domain-containing protein, partial [Lacipirellula sp.]